MLGAFFQALEVSTSALSAQDTASSSNASPTPTDAESLQGTGPESRASQTFDIWENNLDGTIYRHKNQAPPLKSICSRLWLTSSAAASPAKTSPSPVAAEDSQESAQDSSSSSHESLTLFSPMEAGCSLRTYPDSFPPTVDEISPSYSRRWPSSGFTTSPGECWTADTSECPKDGGAYSSLPDVLEADVHPRFYLSPRAAAGILRRAEKRGKPLPSQLMEALTTLAADASTLHLPSTDESRMGRDAIRGES